MKTLLLAPELFTNNGGIPRILRLYLIALCDLAEQNASSTEFIALNDLTADSRDLKNYTNGTISHWICCSGNKARFIRAALKRSRGIDRIVCGHIGQLPVALAASLRHPNLTYDLVAHGIEVWRPLSLLEKISLWRARRVYCVSNYTRQQLIRFSRLREDKFVVLPNALDPFFRIVEAATPPEKPPVILTVARLTKDDAYKGIDSLIQAMPAVCATIPGARLRIIGQGNDAGRLRTLANKLGLGKTVEMCGFVSDSALSDHFQQSTLFALPSKKEGFGLVFLEAMAHGRPCLGADAGGIPDVITPDTGLMVEYGNIPAIAAAIISGVNQQWNYHSILERARYFDFEHFRQRFASLLNS